MIFLHALPENCHRFKRQAYTGNLISDTFLRVRSQRLNIYLKTLSISYQHEKYVIKLFFFLNSILHSYLVMTLLHVNHTLLVWNRALLTEYVSFFLKHCESIHCRSLLI